MSSDSASMPQFLPRRGLNARQAATVEKIFDAGERLLAGSGYEDLTLRLVAAEAGVSPATVYTYFSSKNHLCAGVYCRYVLRATAPEPGDDPVESTQQLVRHLSATVAAAPDLASAATRSLMAPEEDVAHLRLTLGRHWTALFRAALGDRATPELLDAILLAFSGALLHAGMDALDYDELGDLLATAVATVLRGNV